MGDWPSWDSSKRNGENIMVRRLCLLLILVASNCVSQGAIASYLNGAAAQDYYDTLCSQSVGDATASCQGAGWDSVDVVYMQYDIIAYGDALGLHDYDEVDATGPVTPAIWVTTVATTRLQDWFYFNASDPQYAVMTMTVRTDGAGAALTALDLGGGGAARVGECTFYDAGSCSVSVPIANTAFGIGLSLQLHAYVQCAADPLCASVSDYSNTSFISSVTFADANGNPLEMAYTTQSGLTYPMEQPAHGVPEPSSLLLAVAAMAALLGTRAHLAS